MLLQLRQTEDGPLPSGSTLKCSTVAAPQVASRAALPAIFRKAARRRMAYLDSADDAFREQHENIA